jgi:hypothetical protein
VLPRAGRRGSLVAPRKPNPTEEQAARMMCSHMALLGLMPSIHMTVFGSKANKYSYLYREEWHVRSHKELSLSFFFGRRKWEQCGFKPFKARRTWCGLRQLMRRADEFAAAQK